VLAGASFGALTVAVRWGLYRAAEPEVGALVAAALGAFASAAAAAPSAAAQGLDIGKLWPFLAAGLIAPGASQVFLTLAVRHAGASRAAILMGSAPLIAILIALPLLGEPFRPLLEPTEYEAVRAHPRRFLIALDHENPEIERVVDENGQFAVVETFVGEASRIAEETDSRVLSPGH
jgi:uncharacterized membrane protein